MKKTGARELKAAKIKLDVLIGATQLVGQKPFRDLHVEEICGKAGISKVTLFKYFPQKDDVLLYYFRIWCLDRAIDLYHNPKEGLGGIRFILEKFAESYEKNPGLVLGLLSYYTSLQRPPAPFPLKMTERKMLYPNEQDIEQIELFSLPQMLEKFLLEAIFKKEITGMSDTKDLTNVFLSLIFGSIITAHIRQIRPLKIFFKQNLDILLKKLN